MGLELCIVCLYSSSESGNIVITKKKSSKRWYFDKKNRKWYEAQHLKLKNEEIEVLKFSAMGYTVNEVADKITLYCPDCQSTKIKKNGNAKVFLKKYLIMFEMQFVKE